MMPCISRKFIVPKAFDSLSYCLVLIFLLNNLHCSTSTTTLPSVQGSSSNSSQEPTCTAVKDIFTQRGVADKDLPANFPIKGELRLPLATSVFRKVNREVNLLPPSIVCALTSPISITQRR